ncbi:hypothetical protein ACFX5D_06750 [Flavobacterium sp. LB3P45]|uniref:Uncharacterized protein n=1 Tax=Flavobacterium fructosi TaxID=3230416 RepID=A0ABW6HKW0_9FLAO
MFSGILNVATNVSLIPFLTNKKEQKLSINFYKKGIMRIFEHRIWSYSRYPLQSFMPNTGIKGFSLLSGLKIKQTT